MIKNMYVPRYCMPLVSTSMLVISVFLMMIIIDDKTESAKKSSELTESLKEVQVQRDKSDVCAGYLQIGLEDEVSM